MLATEIVLLGSVVVSAFSQAQFCALSGRVVDERGQPVAHVAVLAIPVESPAGQSRFRSGTVSALMQAGDGVVTDDRGEYRIEHLRQRRYYVNTMTLPATFGAPPTSKGFSPTFYPAVREIDLATPIDLTRECEMEQIDIVVHEVSLVTIRGSVVNADGSPRSEGGVTLVLHDGPGGMASAPVLADGTFILTGVAPGSYTLRASPSRSERAGLFTLPTVDVVVGDLDLTGVIVAPSAPLTVRGRMSFDATASSTSLRQSPLRLIARLLDPKTSSGPAIVTTDVNDDGSFALQVPSGPVVFGLASSLPALGRWTIAAVRAGGVDVTDNLRVERNVDDVEIEVTAGAPQVLGVAVDTRGSRVTNYVAVVFSQEPQRWRLPYSRYVRTTKSNAAGSFSVVGLPLGNYYAVAVPDVAHMRWQNPTTLELLAPHATPLLIPGDGDVQLPFLDCDAIPDACTTAR